MVVRDGLQLERALLRVVGGEDLVEDDERAVAVARGEHQALAVGRPVGGWVSKVCSMASERKSEGTYQDMSVNSS